MSEYVELWLNLLRVGIILSSLGGAWYVIDKRHFLRFWVLIVLSVLEILFLFHIEYIIPTSLSKSIFLLILFFCSIFLGFTKSYINFEQKIEQKLQEYKVLPK